MVQYLGRNTIGYMSYTKNPNMPRVRRDAAAMVGRKYTVAQVARRYGVGTSTICKWMKKARMYGNVPIVTLSSRPKQHPKQISRELMWKIYHKRIATKRCAEVIHQELSNEGTTVSLSTVKRTLNRMNLTKKRSPWKRYHPHVDRPLPLKPGDLVEVDTIHTMQSEKKRMYTFVLIDVYSRWVYAKSYQRMNAATTLRFVREAQKQSPFVFSMLQSDHGPEFGSWFVSQIQKSHRYTRIGKPNDNAHIERMNRTLQEECLDAEKRTPRAFNKALLRYVPYYNEKRLHLGIGLRSPVQLFTNCVQGID
jgi:transposase InsO family protein